MGRNQVLTGFVSNQFVEGIFGLYIGSKGSKDVTITFVFDTAMDLGKGSYKVWLT